SPSTLCDHPNGGFLVMSRLLTVIGAFVALLAVSPALAEKSIVVSSTTSTQDSGLFGRILPLFKSKTGIEVRVAAQGTRQARGTGRRGDADVVGADYGLTVVGSASSQAYQFAIFVLSVDGQRILAKHGFAAPALPQ